MIKMGKYLFFFLFLLFTSCLIREKNIYKEAESLFHSNKYKEASILFNGIEHVEKFSPAIYYYKGLCYYFNRNYDSAIKNLNLAFINNFEMEKTTFFLGESYYGLGKLDSAEFFYFMAMGRNMTHDLYHYKLALVYFRKKNYEGSLSFVSKAMELNAHDRRYYYLKSRIYFYLEKYELSLDYINEVLSYERNYEYIQSRSVTYFANKQYNSSLDDARELVNLDSLNPDGYYLKAINFIMLNEIDSACLNANKSLKIDSSFQASIRFVTKYCKY